MISQNFDFNGLEWSICDMMFLLDSYLSYFYKSEMETIPNLKEILSYFRVYAWEWVLLKYLLAEIYPDVAKCQRKTYGLGVRESHFNTIHETH